MITANKNKQFEKLFYTYLQRYLLKKNLHTIYLEGEISVDSNTPVIFIANHSSWWDGLLLFYLTSKNQDSNFYIMMDEEGLEKYPFFRKLGAYSINRSRPKDILKALQYSEQLMRDQKSVWMFPQGKIEHQAVRPIQFQSGIGYLLQRFDHVIVKPVSLHYYFTEVQKPIVSIRFGEPCHIEGTSQSRSYWTSYVEQILENQVRAHEHDVIHAKLEDAVQAMPLSKSTSDHFDAFKKGVKKWMPF
ncbi:lysophospholipid acyltransferase family protein [Paraliobacillus salinarum]|uniref:lysophospholipid acyltransferase family protein n=1 Tax=Paraliobacillus salinarum TaxID=1158996 RepID=UPI0015F4F6A7|nr:lysophospholipid acyltransferase family protein [Paraliobacillus salinarum]